MANNERFLPDWKRSLPVPAGTVAGDPIRVGALNGVAITDRASSTADPFNADGSVNTNYNRGGGNPGGYASVVMVGAHDLKVTAAAAPALGDAVYFDAAATPKLTVTQVGAAPYLPLFGAVASDDPINNGDGTFTVAVHLASPTI